MASCCLTLTPPAPLPPPPPPTPADNTADLPSSVAAGLLVVICFYVSGFSWSWGPLGWLVPSELQVGAGGGAGGGGGCCGAACSDAWTREALP